MIQCPVLERPKLSGKLAGQTTGNFLQFFLGSSTHPRTITGEGLLGRVEKRPLDVGPPKPFQNVRNPSEPCQTLPNPSKPSQTAPNRLVPPTNSQSLANPPKPFKPSQTSSKSAKPSPHLTSRPPPPHLRLSQLAWPIHECIFRGRYSMNMWWLEVIGRDIWVWVLQTSLFLIAFPRVG